MFRKLKYTLLLLNSRNIFQNWLSAGVKYLLIRYGLIKDDITIKCSNNIFTLDPKVYSFIISAYYNGYLKDVSCGDMLRGRLWDVTDFVSFKDGRGFLKMPDDVTLSLESLDPIVIPETWLYDIHFLGFDLTDYLIIYVGAFVIAVEPLPSNYEVMLRNIELNPDLKPRIMPINVAIGAKDDVIEFSYDSSVDGSAGI